MLYIGSQNMCHNSLNLDKICCSNHFKLYKSVVYNAFSKLCNHTILIIEHFHYPPKEPFIYQFWLPSISWKLQILLEGRGKRFLFQVCGCAFFRFAFSVNLRLHILSGSILCGYFSEFLFWKWFMLFLFPSPDSRLTIARICPSLPFYCV